jgi:hypothetical protein
MKQIALALTALFVAASALAQGTLNFQTKVTGSLDAPVTYGGANANSAVMGQLYAAAPGGTLAAIGAPVPFRDAPAAAVGYIIGGTVDAGVAASSSVQVKLVAWAASQGATYAEALGKGTGGTGESGVITVITGGGLTPPANLVGLAGFGVSAIVPEPSVVALGLLGAGLLLIRRKK